MSNTTNTTETMAQRHTRLIQTVPMFNFLTAVAADWKSGDMTLARMESVVVYDCHVIRQLKGYKKFVGKLERIGRLGHGDGPSFGMGRVTPNEIHAYLVTLTDFLEENGWDGLTKEELGFLAGPHGKCLGA